MEKRGRREFVQVLRLMEVFRAEDVTVAVRGALSLGAISVDAVNPNLAVGRLPSWTIYLRA